MGGFCDHGFEQMVDVSGHLSEKWCELSVLFDACAPTVLTLISFVDMVCDLSLSGFENECRAFRFPHSVAPVLHLGHEQRKKATACRKKSSRSCARGGQENAHAAICTSEFARFLLKFGEDQCFLKWLNAAHFGEEARLNHFVFFVIAYSHPIFGGGQQSWGVSSSGRLEFRVNLAYTCVKPLVRLYVCQRVAFFMTHFGSIWFHVGSKKIVFGFPFSPFGIHLGKY